MRISLRINGTARELEVSPGDTLLDLLRREGFHGVKRGCEKGSCGSCIVLINGRAVNSCLVFSANTEGDEIVTIEGIKGGADSLHPLQRALVEEGAVQCGYCTPGMVLSAISLLKENRLPSREEILIGLSGNLCRCTGYVKIVDAVERASREMNEMELKG